MIDMKIRAKPTPRASFSVTLPPPLRRAVAESSVKRHLATLRFISPWLKKKER